MMHDLNNLALSFFLLGMIAGGLPCFGIVVAVERGR